MSTMRILALSICAVVAACGGGPASTTSDACHSAADCGSGHECCVYEFASFGGHESSSCIAANSCDVVQGVDTFQSVTCVSDADCKGRVYEKGDTKNTTTALVCCPIGSFKACVAGTSCG